MSRLYKDFKATTKTVNEAQGLVETIFSVTGVKDRQGDVIVPGAFAKALKGRKPTVVFSHSWTDIGQVLGHVKDWAECLPYDSRLPADLYSAGYGGVWAVVQFNLKVPAGRTAFELVKGGDLKEWSFAFDIDTDGEKFVDNVRHIKSIREIYELTLTVIGANQLTQTTSAKSPRATATLAYAQARIIASIKSERKRKDWETIFGHLDARRPSNLMVNPSTSPAMVEE